MNSLSFLKYINIKKKKIIRGTKSPDHAHGGGIEESIASSNVHISRWYNLKEK
jgi:hypothetical protein